MIDEQKTPDTDDELLLTDEVEHLDDEDGRPDPERDAEGEDEEVVTFGDEAEPQEGDSGLVKHLRQVAKDAQREAAELRKQVRQPERVEIGPKPTLWDDEIGGDEDKYDEAMEDWRARKAAAERQTAVVTEANEEQQKAMSTRLEKVAKAKTALGQPDADEAFENVKAALGEERAAAIVMIADSEEGAAKLIYALGKHPVRLTSLAAVQDPLRFVKEVSKLEGQVKTMKRKRVIEPDTPEKGSGKMSRDNPDKHLAKLEAEAEKNGGDRTKIAAYIREKKQAAKG